MKKLRITVNGVSYDVEVEILEDDEEVGYGYAATHVQPPPVPTVVPPPSAMPPAMPPAVPPAVMDPKTLTSPIPGVVREVKVKPGDSVEEHVPLIVIETMKMDTIISSPVAGVIKEIQVQVNQDVKQGQILVTFA